MASFLENTQRIARLGLEWLIYLTSPKDHKIKVWTAYFPYTKYVNPQEFFQV